MVRPFAFIGFTVFIVLSIIFINVKAAIFLIITAIAAFIISMCIPKSRREFVIPTVSMSVVLAVLLSLGVCGEAKRTDELFDSKTALVQARFIDNESKIQDRYYNTVETIKIGNVPYKTKIKLKSKESLHAQPYDLIECRLKLKSTAESKYYVSDNIYLSANVGKDARIKAQLKKPLHFYILNARKNIIASLENNLPQRDSSLAKALLIGDKSDLNEEVKTDFSNVGIAHMTAVSGLHLSIWCLFALQMLKKAGLRGRMPYAISAVLVIFIMGVTGFTKSVVRAGIMMLLVLIGRIIAHRADAMNSLGFAVLLMCFYNPFCVLDTGLLLSLLATLGLILGYKAFKVPYKEDLKNTSRIRAGINKLYNYLLGIIISSVFACVFTLPITVLSFKKIPLFMLSANLLLSLPAVVCMISAGLLSLACNIGFLSFTLPLLKFLTIKSADFILYTAQTFSSIKYSYIKTEDDIFFFFFYIISFILMIGCVVKYLKPKFNFKIPVAACAALIAVFCGVCFYDEMSKVTLTVCDVGNGTAVVVENRRETALIGCGGTAINGYSSIQRTIDKSGCENIRFMYLPRAKKSQSGYMKPVLYRNEVEYLLLGEDNKELKKTFPQLKYKVNANSSINLWKNISLKCYTSNNESYAILDVNSSRILINFLPSAKIDENDKDVIIFAEKLPKGATLSDAYCAIASTDYTNGIYAQRHNENAAATAGQGNIEIELYKNGKIKVERV